MNKTANSIVNETFEKIADFSMGDMLSEETIKKMKDAASKGTGKVQEFGSNTGNGTNFKGTLNNVKKKAPSMEQIKEMVGNKPKTLSKNKALIGAGVGAAAIGAGATALALSKKKKEKAEKTASEIVSEVFEKIEA